MDTGESSGLVRAFLLDGSGGGHDRSWAEVRRWTPEEGTLWIHLDADHAESQAWLRGEAGLGEVACDSLLAQGSRPRCTALEDGLLVVLRAVNLNANADPEDMVALRVWVDATRLITLSRKPLKAVGDLAGEIERGQGPSGSGAALAAISGNVLERMAPTLADLDDEVDGLEERAFQDTTADLQEQLADARRRVIALRRHLAPQRDAMARLGQAKVGFIDESLAATFHLLSEFVARHVEGLEHLKDRATVSYELLASRQADALNRRMLFLAIVTAVFLPLGLIAGMLGINVGGIPGASNEHAFAVVCGLMIVIGGLQVWVLKRLRWW